MHLWADRWLDFARDGSTFDVVASTIGETRARIDLGGLPATKRGRFRVVVSDGLRSATSVARSVTRVAGHAPTVAIRNAVDNMAYSAGAATPFAVSSADVDGDKVRRVVWTSSRDGVVGHGSQVTLAGLSIGTHRLTAAVTDTSGAVGKARVRLRVLARALRIRGIPSPDKVAPKVRRKGSRLVFSEPVVGVGSRQIRVAGAKAVTRALSGDGRTLVLKIRGRARKVTVRGTTDVYGNVIRRTALRLR